MIEHMYLIFDRRLARHISLKLEGNYTSFLKCEWLVNGEWQKTVSGLRI
ncbi:MAG: hypothetical protein LBI15_09530 [Dysgonamonadaceae bacterium]|jgi:hypothetical protein|nr:hypothetical protein [Dysgonamonadaceae bacterium]